MYQRDNNHLGPQPRSVLAFPVDRARAIETPRQHLRRIHSESNRQLEALAERLNCLGWFDPPRGDPRAA
ncbi:MAG: hypothetical protein GY894_05575 [Planctomycetes bacterium]|nr:hypothetical protein [Planctomycetota bacterium]